MSISRAQDSVQKPLKTSSSLAPTSATYSPVEPGKIVSLAKPQGPMTLTKDGDCLLVSKSKATKRLPVPQTNANSAILMEGLHSSKKSIPELPSVIRKSQSGAYTESPTQEINDPTALDKLSASESMIRPVPLLMSSNKMLLPQTQEITSDAKSSKIKKLENPALPNKLNLVWQTLISELFKPVI